VLKNEGVNINLRGIWGVWKRFGYAGFEKEKMTDTFTESCTWTKEANGKFRYAKKLFRQKQMKKSAEILNSIPVLPENKLILQIPDSYLNLRRRVEKIGSSFGKIPIGSYLQQIRNLYEECERKNLHYSSLRVGFLEIEALSWTLEHKRTMQKMKTLEALLKRIGVRPSHLDFSLQFSFLIAEGSTYAILLKIGKAFDTARTCRNLLMRRKYVSPFFMYELGQLYANLGDFREAGHWYLKALDSNDEKTKKIVKNYLSIVYFHHGEYKKAIDLMKQAYMGAWGLRNRIFLYQAIWYLFRGMPHKTILLSTKAIFLFRKEEIQRGELLAYFTIAIAYCSLGESAKAKRILEKLLLFLTKKKQKRTEITLRGLLSRITKTEYCITPDEGRLPTVKLILFLKNGDYVKALKYAEKKGILSYFHRYIFFFQELVINRLAKGQSTGLPKAMLKLPVFNKEVPVYYIKFLGNLIVYKGGQYLKFKLLPTDSAFLIHLAMRTGEPGRHIPLQDLYNNFWRHGKNPARNLSNLLFRIKKSLKIPSHLIEVSHHRDRPVLTNSGVHFITDYQEFEQMLAAAGAFQRAGEWNFAKKEYLAALNLIRSESFTKMYDSWSEDMRAVIFNKYENAIKSVVQECKAHNDHTTAKRVLMNAHKIIKFPEETNEMMQSDPSARKIEES